jgi:hypothetical protein
MKQLITRTTELVVANAASTRAAAPSGLSSTSSRSKAGLDAWELGDEAVLEGRCRRTVQQRSTESADSDTPSPSPASKPPAGRTRGDRPSRKPLE